MKSTSHNLVMSALYNGRKGDRPPAGNPTSIVCHGLMDAAGVSFPEAHLDANAMADLALAGHEILGFDTVMPEYSVHQESAALGSDVDWGDRDTMPDSKTSPYADFSDIQIPENILEKPSIRVVLDALFILRHTEPKGTIIMCTVKGDIHDISKNLVIMMLEGTGFHVINLGVDLTVEKLIREVEEMKPNTLGLSALLTTTMPEMKKVIEELKALELRDRVKVMVGGAPVNAAFAEKIGTDAYGKDAVEAVKISRGFVRQT